MPKELLPLRWCAATTTEEDGDLVYARDINENERSSSIRMRTRLGPMMADLDLQPELSERRPDKKLAIPHLSTRLEKRAIQNWYFSTSMQWNGALE